MAVANHLDHKFQHKENVPYSQRHLRQDLQRVRTACKECRTSRDRSAIYGDLTAVYDLVAWWTAEGGKSTKLAGRCARSG